MSKNMKDQPSEGKKLVDQARVDLTRRLGIESKDISVAAIESAQWQDSSLGCPEPGRVYMQMITPGYRIVLEAHGKRYEYRSDRRHVRLCEEAK